MNKTKLRHVMPLIHTIVSIILGITINVAGYYLAHHFSLPFWLNSIGTIFCSCLLGVFAGSFVGVTSTILCNLKNPVFWLYAISQIGISVCANVLYKNSKLQNIFRIVCTSVVITFISICVAVPVNFLFRNGYVGNVWGDALIDMLLQNGNGALFSTILGQAFIELPDKVLSMFIVYFILRLTKKLSFHYKGGDRI